MPSTQFKILTVFIITIGVMCLLVDPWAYYSFTVPKYYFFLLTVSLCAFFVIVRRCSLQTGIIPVLFFVRILWLGLTDQSWVTHPSNVSFLLVIGILIMMVSMTQFKRNCNITSLAISLILVGVVETVIGIWQLVTFIPNPSFPVKTPFIGTIGSSNGLGILLVLSLLSGIYLTISSSKKNLRWFYVILSTLTLVGLVLSESRGAWLSFILATIVVLTIKLNSSNKVKASLKRTYLISTIVILFTSVIGLYQLNKESSGGRWMIWEISWNMITDHVVSGVGPGNYSIEYLNYQAEYLAEDEHQIMEAKAANIKQAHNEYLQAFAEGGVIGGILFLAIWIIPLIYMLKRVSENTQGIQDFLQLAIHISIMVHSFVDSPLHIFPVSIIGYANIAMMPLPLKEISISKVGKLTGASIVLVLFGIVIFRTIQIYPGYHLWKQGTEQVSHGDWKPAISSYEQAMERIKENGELSFHLGSALVIDEQYSKGIFWLERAKEDFNDRNIYLSEGLANIRFGNYREAEKNVLIALDMFPTHLAPHLLLGEIYYELGEFEKSKESLMKCITEDISVKSVETKQIVSDAKAYWLSRYGALPKE